MYGADCTTLLGTIPALHPEQPVGLLFVDGHEDTMPLDVSEDGEAANCEIGLLLGLTGRLLRGRLAERLPALEQDELAMLGQRDAAWRRQFNVGSLRDAGVWRRDWREVAAAPETAGAQAAEHLQQGTRRWWLHVDLDVLDPEEFPAQGLPDVDDEPDGLTWGQLTAAVTAAVTRGGCLGMSVAIYDPDQDPDRSDAHRILRFFSDVIDAAPTAMSGWGTSKRELLRPLGLRGARLSTGERRGSALPWPGCRRSLCCTSGDGGRASYRGRTSRSVRRRARLAMAG